MQIKVDGKLYDVIIQRKKSNRGTYIRVKKDLKIYVTTNYFSTLKSIQKLIESNYDKIVDMIKTQEKRSANSDGFFYLGKKYNIVYVDYTDISLGENKVFMKKGFDVDKWYKKQAEDLFKRKLEEHYQSFSKKIPHPTLRIRKMKSRWGVCNIKTHIITLNLELMKRKEKYLDYVIVHELSHLIHPDHSSKFWDLVEENFPKYKECRKEMKDF